MLNSVVWAAMTYVSLMGVLLVVALPGRLPGSRWARPGRLVIVAAACAAGLAALGVLYQVRAVAAADAEVVEELSGARRGPIVEAFRVITTMGDTVPSFTIAAILAVWLIGQPRSSWFPVLLPGLVLLQLALQFAFPEVFPVYVLTDIKPDLAIDGSGVIPSGSVARLSSLFVTTWLIYQRSFPGGGRWLLTVGGAAVLLEIATRLLLGRHFVADIVGGFLLGGFLISVMALLPGICPSDSLDRPGNRPRGGVVSG